MDFRRVGVCGQNLLKETPGAAAHDEDKGQEEIIVIKRMVIIIFMIIIMGQSPSSQFWRQLCFDVADQNSSKYR